MARRSVHGLEPLLLPKNQTGGLTAAIDLSITAQVEMNSVGQLPTRRIPIENDGVAGFVRAFVYFEALAAILKHLRHERHAVESALLVERPQDLFLASDFDQIACPQPAHSQRPNEKIIPCFTSIIPDQHQFPVIVKLTMNRMPSRSEGTDDLKVPLDQAAARERLLSL